MKRRWVWVGVAFLVLLPGGIHPQPAGPDPGGSTLSGLPPGPFLVEDLEMVPDPVQIGQEVRFKLRLRNGGAPARATIRIQDRDEIVTMIDHVRIEPGTTEYPFPDTGYSLQRNAQCFNVVIDAEGIPHHAATLRDLCARSLGWTLRP